MRRLDEPARLPFRPVPARRAGHGATSVRCDRRFVAGASSVALLANECKVGHACKPESDGTGIRAALLTSLHTDKNPGVRLKALEGLQPYVTQDERVRDAVLQALLSDSSATIRTRAISLLEPVQSDTSVRQVLRTVSTTDENPYIRTVSTQALEGSSSIQ